MDDYVEPEIKQAYIDLCLRRGGCYEIPNNTPFHNGPFVHKHVHYNLTVLSVPGKNAPDSRPAVFYSYWTSKARADIEHCVGILERRILLDEAFEAQADIEHCGEIFERSMQFDLEHCGEICQGGV